MEWTKRAEVPDLAVTRRRARVVEQRTWSDTGFELVLERNGLAFEAGRLLTLHGRDVTEDRSYTIASGENDTHLHILYRLVPSGVLTPQLALLKPGDELELSGPYGQFVCRDPLRPCCFIATGTGIAPCRAYVRTYPGLDVTVIHGVRTQADLFFRDEFPAHAYHPCLTGETDGGFHGRVTDFLAQHVIDQDKDYYLCGAYEMIYDAQDRLISAGVDAGRIFTEGYYYRLEA